MRTLASIALAIAALAPGGCSDSRASGNRGAKGPGNSIARDEVSSPPRTLSPEQFGPEAAMPGTWTTRFEHLSLAYMRGPSTRGNAFNHRQVPLASEASLPPPASLC